jgi:hypothetical protein
VRGVGVIVFHLLTKPGKAVKVIEIPEQGLRHGQIDVFRPEANQLRFLPVAMQWS